MKVVKSKPVVSKEVMEVNAEEMLPEVPLEKVINDALVKSNVTDQVIAALKEKYGSLRLKDINDKESYLEVKEARKEVRKVGIVTEKLCKKGREDAVAIQRKWLEKENEILKKIAEIEDPLNAEIERFDNEVERKEIEENKRKEGIYINRQSTLSKLGATYDNGSFVLNNISYEVDLIKNADEEMWTEIILPKYRKVFEEIEAVKVEEENKRKAELAEEKRKRAEFDQQQKKFKEEQELFAKQQQELQEQKDAIAREQRLEQDRKELEDKNKKQVIVDARIFKLKDLGFGYNGVSAYVFGDMQVFVDTQIRMLNEEDWNILIESITPRVQELLRESYEKIQEENKKREQELVNKALADQKLKEQQVHLRKEEELTQANDRTKWLSFIAELKMLVHSEMKSPMYKSKQAKAKEKIDEILSL